MFIKQELIKNKIGILFICIVGFVVNFIAFNPGFTSPDSFDQYNQALKYRFTDWHPPIMAFVWSLLNKLYQGPQLMLVLQLFFLWTACFFLAVSLRGSIKWIVVVITFCLAPFVQNFAGYIIKDSQMALSWLLCIAILFHYTMIGGKYKVAVALVSALLLLYGAWLRHNSLPALLPLCFLWASVIFYNKKNKVKVAVGMCLLLGILMGQKIFNKLLHPAKENPEELLYMLDMTGIFVKTGDNVFPLVLYTNPDFDTAYLRKKYNPACYDMIWWNQDKKSILPGNVDVIGDLHTAWLNAIRTHPIVYLKNRVNGFIYFLRIKNRERFFCNYYFYVYPNPGAYGCVAVGNNVFYRLICQGVSLQDKMPYLRAWFWAVLNLVLLIFVPYFKKSTLSIFYSSIVLSGFLYFLPQFFLFTTDTDFRYMYWNCIACSLAILVFIANRYFLKANNNR